MQPIHSSLVSVLRWRAENQPQRLAYRFLSHAGGEPETLTYADLDRRVRMVGGLLQRLLAPGSRVVLLYPPGLDNVIALYGCLYAGMVVIPAYPPTAPGALARVQAIIADARAAAVLATSAIRAMFLQQQADPLALRPPQWLTCDAAEPADADTWREPPFHADALALLQYTSGSTAAPRGVMVGHDNLLHNLGIIQQRFGHTGESHGVIWLPPYHDMGLIGGIFQPLYSGFPVTLMSPLAFLQSPLRWLKAISHYRATTSGGPNFAYDLCVQRIKPQQRATLDLGSWQVAFNGAEPVRSDTMERFAAAFAPCGFRRSAFYPCYGLAEATLFVAGRDTDIPIAIQRVEVAALQQQRIRVAKADAPSATTLVGCGSAGADQTVVIVDPVRHTLCTPGTIGEIWVAGPSVARGYWNRPDETRDLFQARLADGAAPFLRTQDLGYLSDGDLFVVGRIKEVIIIRGRNYYPQDIELAAAQSHPNLRLGGSAAFAVSGDGEEQLVIVQELEQPAADLDAAALATAMRQAVTAAQGALVHTVVFVRPGSIPRTTSGKVQRLACRDTFQAGRLAVIARHDLAATPADLQSVRLEQTQFATLAPAARLHYLIDYLRTGVATVLRVDAPRIAADVSLNGLGLDSLMAVELSHRVEADLGVALAIEQVLRGDSLAQIAARLLAALAEPPTPAQEPAAQAPHGTWPLSFGQRALWFLHQLAPHRTPYNIANAVRVRSPVDVAALQRAFQRLVARHPALRTTVTIQDGQPVQVVHRRRAVAFQVVEAALDEPAIDQYLVGEAYRPFDLEHGPLLRIHLLRCSPADHVLLVTVHHIVADFWSLAVLVYELRALYQAECDALPAALPPIAQQYTDFIIRQQALLAGPEGDRLWRYWQARLADLPQQLDLPAARPRSNDPTYHGASHPFSLPVVTTERLRTLTRATGCTLYMLLLSALFTLLYRATNQHTLAIGSPTSGRRWSQLSHTVGYFVNPIVLRADLSDTFTFAEVLQHVRQVVLEAFAHQDFPFALLVERLQTEHNRGWSPLVQAAFVLQKAQLLHDEGLSAFALGEAGATMALGRLELEAFPLSLRMTQFDLTLIMVEAGDRLLATWQYASDRFDAASIAGLADQFVSLLENVAADPTRLIDTIPLIDAETYRRFLHESPRTSVEIPALSLHEQFEAQVAQTPDAVAVVIDRGQGSGVRGQGDKETRRQGDKETRRQGDREIRSIAETHLPSPIPHPPSPIPRHVTYAELNVRANRLAHYLRALGVGPETAVGLLVERAPELVVGILGILKAGGAYVPIDPAYPAERIAWILTDARPAVVVTQPSLYSALSYVDVPIVDLCAADDRFAHYPSCNPGFPSDPDQQAYIIYTSGSTGRPKGVAVAHRQVLRLFAATRPLLQFGTADTWTLFHSIAFDFSVWELWGALLHGGRLVVVRHEVSQSADAFYRLVQSAAVSVLSQTPSAFYALLQAEERAPSQHPLALRWVIFGGEALHVARLRPWFARHGDQMPRLVNMYGITETTVHVTYRPLAAADLDSGAGSVIGAPLADLHMYVLDRRLQPVPPGIVGELYVGGAGLARGYLNRPDLTAERFIPNPFADHRPTTTDQRPPTNDGEPRTKNQELGFDDAPVIQNSKLKTQNLRLYRTGDLVRCLANGDVEYLGRADQQVKVRGFRVEPGEIEAAIGRHPAVRACAVVGAADSMSGTRLVAYLVIDPEQPAAAPSDADMSVQAGQVTQWQSVFDDIYRQGADDDPTFDIVGWNSSYSGLPIAAGEMREWVEQTVARIQALNPRHVLEIGCGSGLLLFRIAPRCDSYRGTDISSEALRRLRATLAQPQYQLPNAVLEQCAADALPAVVSAPVDTVILNSVAQYFPSVEYLVEVIEQAVAQIDDGGAMFIGDLRHLPLLEAFHASVLLHQAPDALSAAQLRQQLQQRLALEEELVVSPAFFFALQQRLPRIRAVHVLPKRGRSANELTLFRYDVVLMIGEPAAPGAPIDRLDWTSAGLSMADLQHCLEHERPHALRLAHVPNARVQMAVHAAAAIAQARPVESVATLRTRLVAGALPGIDPEDLWQLGERCGYSADISWADAAPDGSFAVSFIRRDSGARQAVARERSPVLPPANWHSYANRPLRKSASQAVLAGIRQQLSRQLPAYMIPSAFVVLDSLPLTPHGKLDRQALPAPDRTRPELDLPFAGPQTPLEAQLAAIWAEVLDLDRVGVHDNFFAIGGHSLLATQIMSRIRAAWLCDLPLRAIFEAPTVAGLAAQIPAAQQDAPHSPPPIIPVPRGAPLPLSFAQQRLWFLYQLEPDQPFYNMPSATLLCGELSIAALARGLREVVRRHEVLRTRFVATDGRPEQQIIPTYAIALPVVDLSGLPEALREERARQAAQAAARAPFNLARDQLFRCQLLRLAPARHVLLLTLHHIVADGWSIGVLVRELTALYTAFLHDRPAPLAELPIQYADFAHWQRMWLQGGALERQLRYWTRQLGGVLPVLDLPTDRPRPPVQTYHGATYTVALPQSAAALTARYQHRQITPFMSLLAAFAALLHRLTGQVELIVGTPIANRTQVAIEPLIGFFVNTLALRLDCSGDPPFRQLLERVRHVTLEAYQHQDLPFEQLVEVLQPQRDHGRTPIFQVLFALQNTAPVEMSLPGLVASALEIDSGTAKFDLSFLLHEQAERIICAIEYNRDLFDATTIARMAERYQGMVQAVLDDDLRLTDLPLLTAAERDCLSRWNSTTALWERSDCVHTLFEYQAAHTPEAVAVVFDRPTTNDQRPTTTDRHGDTETRRHGDTETGLPTPNTQHPTSNTQHLTYRELNERANRLAHHLRALGVGPEAMVGLCVDRSMALLIGLLGIVKAGGVYVPIDPSYPRERRRLMREQARLALVVAQESLAEQAGDGPCPVILLDRDQPVIAPMPDTNPPPRTVGANLLYLLYTSGSTGQPKGVTMPHCALVNLLRWQQRHHAAVAGTTTAQFTSLNFDVAAQEIWSTLCFGGTLLLIAETTRRDSVELLALIDRMDVARLFMPFVALQQLASAAARRELFPRGLREIISAGEQLQITGPLAELCRALPGCRLSNHYGPTESHVVTALTLRGDPAEWPQLPPIGSPIANTQIYLLDRHMRQVPIGVAGELHIGGVSLARGYLHQPDLTAERFVPNPFGGVLGDGYWVLEDSTPNTRHPTPNTRLYKTGDLARWLPNGTLEFLGRLDQQVKLRGFRIELGEVEALLGQHPLVREAAVLAREDVPGERRLVAYVVPKIEDRGLKLEDSGSDARDPLSSILYPLSSELRDFLKDKLPDYMIPSAFVLLDRLPLTPTGKLDRRALPEPTRQSLLNQTVVEPQTPLELLLADCWSEALGLHPIGIHDNLFSLGAHSLLAIQVMARASTFLQRDLPVRLVFEFPTIAGLAQRLTLLCQSEQGIVAPPIAPVARAMAIPLSFAQERLWLLDQIEPGNTAYHLSTAVQLAGPLNAGVLERCLYAVLQRHQALRTSFPSMDGQPVQSIMPSLSLPFVRIDLSGLEADRRKLQATQIIAELARHPFDLAAGPLLRGALLRLDDETHVLFLVMHHIICDGWSLNILTRELGASYAAALSGQPVALPDLPLQYADVAVWQRAWLQGSGVGGQGSDAPEEQRTKNTEQNREHHDQGSGARGQGSARQGDKETRRQGDKEIGYITNPQSPVPNPQSPSQPAPCATLVPHPSPPPALRLSPIQAHLDYWLERLRGASMTIDLPLGQPRPAVRQFRGSSAHMALAPALTATLAAQGRHEGVTLFMSLLTAFAALLHRYTGQGDIIVGVPIANRHRAELAGVVGCLINTLPLRFALTGDLSFRTLLQQVRTRTLEAYTYQHLPFEILLEHLQLERDLSRTPIFQIVCNFLGGVAEPLDLPGICSTPYPLLDEDAKFDLTLYAHEQHGALQLRLVYAQDLFEPRQIQTLLAHLQTVFEHLVASPDQPISTVPLAPPAGEQPRRQQLQTIFPRAEIAQSIPDRFARIVRQHPDRIAVYTKRHTLTYAQLDRAARRVAQALLHTCGDDPAQVALLFEHDAPMLSGLLGTLMAGKTYVPIDPAYPRERIIFMLRDAQVSALVTDDAHLDLARELNPAAPIVTNAADSAHIALPRAQIEPLAPAYILYTSGSSGVPKGVVQNHRNVLHHIQVYVNALQITPADRLTLFSSYSFDAAVMDIFGALLNGAALCLIDIKESDPVELAHWLRTQAPTVLHSTPTVYRYLTEIVRDPGAFASVRRVVLGGEEAQPRDVARYRELFPANCLLINGLGPTESTLALQYVLDQQAAITRASIPVGYAVDQTEVRLITDAGTQAAIYGIGEIAICSEYLALGYWQRPDLTAERFLPNPFGGVLGVGCWVSGGASSNTQHPTPNTRLYRTGDLGRYLPDGSIEFVGRRDFQIKIRGHRIETAEVEICLHSSPSVAEAVVVAHARPNGEHSLVAYVVPKIEDRGLKIEDSGSDAPEPLSSILYPLSSKLRDFLKEKLPAYMVPAAFVVQDALPLNPNGKVDRRALQARAPDEAEQLPTTLPRTPLELIVAQVWAAVLQREPASVFDNFFALGGHSLSAARTIARLRDLCKVEIPLRALFEAPTIAGLAARVSAAMQQPALPVLPPLRAMERSPTIPLSFAQQRFWFLEQFDHGGATYHIAAALRLIGPLDRAALMAGLRTIVERHEVLRTHIALVQGQPAQIICPTPPSVCAFQDLRALPRAGREASARCRAQDESRRPFALDTGPLLRLDLLQLDDAEHMLVLVMHHCVADGWSLGVFMNELAIAYNAAVAGRPAPLPPLPIQYADYALWQRTWLQGSARQGDKETRRQGDKEEGAFDSPSPIPNPQSPVPDLPSPIPARPLRYACPPSPSEAQLAYWKTQLDGAPALLALPTDFPRPVVRRTDGARIPFIIPPALTQELARFSQRSGATLFMTLLAAFQVMLMRYTDQEDIVVGTPVAGRIDVATEPLIGCFMNTLALRVSTRGAPTFTELLQRVRATTLEADAHQHVPFEQLVEAYQPARDLSYTPLFQVMFMFQNMPLALPELTQLRVALQDIDTGAARFDLSLIVADVAQELHGIFEYRTDLFLPETIRRMIGHFRTLLEAIVVALDRPITQLPLLSSAERRQLLDDWNHTAVAVPPDLSAQRLIAHQARHAPHAVAVIDEQQQLTYAELDQRSDQLARRLRALGIGAESRIGICLDRSVALLIGLLGVLKAGGCYVPLEPSLPPARLASMIENAQIALLLTQQAYQHTLPPHAAPLLLLDCTDQPAYAPLAPLDASFSSEMLAYLIYTSGSTGEPKGVQVSQRALVNLLLTMQQQPGIGADDLMLATTTLSFDIAGLELWLPLICGARLMLVSRETLDDLLRLAELIERSGATIMQATPTTWRLLLSLGWRGRSTLRILCGGEALPPSLAAQLRPHCGALWNMYGPTETTIWSAAAPTDGQTVTIGRPIANTQLYILDRRLEVVPIGVVGELYIGGDGLARGYQGRPDLTAAAFIPNPFAGVLGDGCWVLEDSAPNTQHPTPNTRLYKTGDLARYRPDGSIEFLGRHDDQVKLHGFRIELEEIETVLRMHPAIRTAAAVIHSNTTGEQRLVAYLVPKIEDRGLKIEDSGSDAPDLLSSILYPRSSELRTFLQERLPAYMLPSAFRLCAALPTTPNGKLDRKKLARQELLPLAATGRPAAPQTAVEALLATIWTQALGIPAVGIDDNFFALGGNSILSINIVARARMHGLSITPRDLFLHPTIAGLAALLDGNPIQSCRLTSSQQRIQAAEPAARCPYQALLLRLGRKIDHTRLEQALRIVQQHHEALRLRFLHTSAGWLQAPIALADASVVELSRDDANEEQTLQALLALADQTGAALHLSDGPLLQTVLIHNEATQSDYLLLVAHKLVIDRASWKILLADLALAHRQLERVGSATLAPATSFTSWVPRSTARDYAFVPDTAGAVWASAPHTSLRSEQTAVLLNEIVAHYRISIDDVLLAAIVQAIGTQTGTASPVIVLDEDARNDAPPDLPLSRTIGRMTEALPVRFHYAPGTAPDALLRQIKEQRAAARQETVSSLALQPPDTRFSCRLPVTTTALDPLHTIILDNAWDDVTLEQEAAGLQIIATLDHEQLRLEWRYREDRYQPAAIQAISAACAAALSAIIAHPRTSEVHGFIPSDFPAAQISQPVLERILHMIRQRRQAAQNSSAPAIEPA